MAQRGEEGYFDNKCVIEVVATKGNRIQIELYYAYLKDVMERLADEAKAQAIAGGYNSRSFRLNFRKGFAQAIGEKLREQKKQKSDIPESGSFANVYLNSLAVQKRDAIEKQAVDALVKHRHPRLSGLQVHLRDQWHQCWPCCWSKFLSESPGHPHLDTATHGPLRPSLRPLSDDPDLATSSTTASAA